MSPAQRPVKGAQMDGGEDPRVQNAAAAAQQTLARALKRARLALIWERVWPGLAGVLVVLALFLSVSFTGVWSVLPALARMAGVALFALLAGFAVWPLLRLRWPDAAEAVARLDRESALAHRPATALSDTLATRPDDPVGVALWRAHLKRAVAAAGQLRAGLPSPGLARRDPRAVRALALLVLVPTFFMADGEHLARLRAAFDWQALTPPRPFRLDAWVDPPSYTARPPVVLPGLRWDDPATLAAAALQVPEGSVLVVRGAGLDLAGLKLEGGIAPQKLQETAAQTAAATPAVSGGGDSAQERRFVISGSADATFLGPDQRRLMWHFKVVPDEAPTIAFARDPRAGPRNVLELAYHVTDDYGVKEAEALFAPVPPEPPLFPRPGAAAPRPPERPLVAPPEMKLSLPPGRRSGGAQTTKDLVAHPWAGAQVKLRLRVRDEAGHEGVSATRVVRLPARTFTNPLARALIDERRLLAFDARNRRRLVAVLTALSDAPDRFALPAGEYLGLRSALAQAKNARNDDDLRALVDYLWEMAVLIEDGTLTEAERELKAAQEALREALERGASDEEIRRLTQDLRAAMDKMMRQLAAEAQRDGGTDTRPLDPNTRIVRPQDLQRMLDQLENLARSGNREAAQQLLNQLQAMMENMRPGQRQAGRQQNGQQSELGNMIQEQQRLRDRTFQQGRERNREPEGQDGEPGPRGQEGSEGQQGGQGQQAGQGQQGFDALRQGQQELRQRLGRMRDALRQFQKGQSGGAAGEAGDQEKAMNEALGRAGEALEQAEQAMREAEESLGRGEGQPALDAEGQALQSLRQGAQALAQGQRGNQGGQPGPGGPGEESADRTDPLGRPMRTQDYGDDYTVKVPDEVDAQRARRVLEELRRRLEQPQRPQVELDYLERLLNGL